MNEADCGRQTLRVPKNGGRHCGNQEPTGGPIVGHEESSRDPSTKSDAGGTPDPGDVDGYWVEPDLDVYNRVDPYWIDFKPVFVRTAGKWRWRMWADHGVEFFIHPAMQATEAEGFPEFFRHDRAGRPRGVIRILRLKER